MSTPFQLLTVCSGNVCRSPLAERMLAHGFAQLATRAGAAWAPGAGIVVRSAGTTALVGEPMTPETVELAAAAGVGADGHIARQLEGSDIERSGLVLALTREHRRAVVAMAPRASRITFTLPEFARILQYLADRGDWRPDGPDASDPRLMLPGLVETAAMLRGHALPPEDPDDDDVVDPYGGPREVYARAGAQIGDAVAALLDALDRLLPVRSR